MEKLGSFLGKTHQPEKTINTTLPTKQKQKQYYFELLIEAIWWNLLKQTKQNKNHFCFWKHDRLGYLNQLSCWKQLKMLDEIFKTSWKHQKADKIVRNYQAKFNERWKFKVVSGIKRQVLTRRYLLIKANSTLVSEVKSQDWLKWGVW